MRGGGRMLQPEVSWPPPANGSGVRLLRKTQRVGEWVAESAAATQHARCGQSQGRGQTEACIDCDPGIQRSPGGVSVAEVGCQWGSHQITGNRNDKCTTRPNNPQRWVALHSPKLTPGPAGSLAGAWPDWAELNSPPQKNRKRKTKMPPNHQKM